MILLLAIELTLGKRLGEGGFCDVMEISDIVLKRKSNSDDPAVTNGNGATSFCLLPEPAAPHHDSSQGDDAFEDETDEADFPVNYFQNKNDVRKYMSEFCMRNDAIEGDQARYALKQLKPTDSLKQLEQGLIDISIEAKFLSCINHPNIIKSKCRHV